MNEVVPGSEGPSEPPKWLWTGSCGAANSRRCCSWRFGLVGFCCFGGCSLRLRGTRNDIVTMSAAQKQRKVRTTSRGPWPINFLPFVPCWRCLTYGGKSHLDTYSAITCRHTVVYLFKERKSIKWIMPNPLQFFCVEGEVYKMHFLLWIPTLRQKGGSL